MESGPRRIMVAVGLFFGGILVGTQSGSGRESGTAHAASLPPEQRIEPARLRERGPVAPGLQSLSRMSGPGRRDLDADIEPMSWTGGGARCSVHPVGEPPRARTPGMLHAQSDEDDPLRGLKMPDLPVPRDPRVLKYVRYFSESLEGRKSFSEALRRSGRFREVIGKSLREQGLPEDLIAVVFIESGFQVDAVSTAGAAGLWQFMPQTARAYGLAVEAQVDERASIWKATDAAAHHLSDLYERFRSWELALAAYNLGYDRLEKRLDEFEMDDFWSLAEAPGALPKETVHYVPKVLAVAVVLANLDELGFGDVERAPPVDGAELEVKSGTRLSVVARAAGTSVRMLRELNPELLGDAAPDHGEDAVIHVPRGGVSRARAMLPKLDDDDADKVSADFDWGKDDARDGRSRLERTGGRIHDRDAKDREPRDREGRERDTRDREPRLGLRRVHRRVREEDATPKAKEASGTARVFYRVAAGDSVKSIADTFGLTVDQVLAQARVASADQIQVGTLLEHHTTESTLEHAKTTPPATTTAAKAGAFDPDAP